jgi:hypothetical protein
MRFVKKWSYKKSQVWWCRTPDFHKSKGGDLLEPEVIDTAVASIDLLNLYHQFPHLRDTATGLAERIKRSPETVARAATRLHHFGILCRVQIGNETVYRWRQSYSVRAENR